MKIVMSQLSLAVDVGGLKLRNPAMNAAGVLGMSKPILKRVYDEGAGAVVTKSIGLVPRKGHSNPTLITVDCGVLNAMGLPNPGVERYIDEINGLKKEGVTVVASFFGSTIEEFRDVASRLSNASVDALELNCSCPNVDEEMGMLGTDPINTERVTAIVKEVISQPLFVKLSPNVTDITMVAMAAKRGGADAVTATNTLKGLAINVDMRRPILKNVTGGLSGPAIKPVALRCVWEIFEKVEIPIIGCGGITDWRDAVEYLLCGATAVEIGTAIKEKGPALFRDVTDGIRKYLEKNGFKKVKDIVGLAHEA